MSVSESYNFVTRNFPSLGLNKSDQVARLFYELSSSTGKSFGEIAEGSGIDGSMHFSQIKAVLLPLRYPSLTEEEIKKVALLPLHNEAPALKTEGLSQRLTPKTIYVEKAVKDSVLAQRFQEKFPNALYEEIDSYQEHVSIRNFNIDDYNARRNEVFIVREKFHFLSQCPCSNGCLRCGYWNLNFGYGCGFDCSYCFLQGYTNAPGIVFPANSDDFFEAFSRQAKHVGRIGNGQLTDSLVFDDVTRFSVLLLSYFRQFPECRFELKTKGSFVDNLLKCEPPKNCVIAWSLNPQKIIDSDEHFTASLDQRLEAAKKCADHGYMVAFHFDPIIYYRNWDLDYSVIVDRIFKEINDRKIAWISLGCLRMSKHVRQIMEARFPRSRLCLSEQIIGFDGKIRYPRRIRREIYAFMKDRIRRYSKKTPLYLCMDDPALAKELGIFPVFD